MEGLVVKGSLEDAFPVPTGPQADPWGKNSQMTRARPVPILPLAKLPGSTYLLCIHRPWVWRRVRPKDL